MCGVVDTFVVSGQDVCLEQESGVCEGLVVGFGSRSPFWEQISGVVLESQVSGRGRASGVGLFCEHKDCSFCNANYWSSLAVFFGRKSHRRTVYTSAEVRGRVTAARVVVLVLTRTFTNSFFLFSKRLLLEQLSLLDQSIRA